MSRLILPRRALLKAGAAALITSPAIIGKAAAQLSGGLMFPGPGTAHSAGGGGTLTFAVANGGTPLTFTGAPTLPFSWAGAGIGASTADRIIIVSIAHLGATGTASSDVSAVTVDGVSLAPAAKQFINSRGESVWWVLLGTDSGHTTGAVTLTCTGGSGFISNAVVSLAVLTGSAAASVASTITAAPPAYNGTTNTNASAVTVPTGGVAIFSAYAESNPGPSVHTWTDNAGNLVVKDTQALAGGTAEPMASMAHTTTSATVTDTVTVNTSGSSGWIAAVFQP